MSDYAYDIEAAYKHLTTVSEDWVDVETGQQVIPQEWEYARLIRYYETYQLAHRRILIDGFRAGASVEGLVKSKLNVKNIDDEVSGSSLGGHVSWAVSKTRKTVIRLLYLRMRFDWRPRQTKRQANRRLLDLFGDEHFGQRNIRNATQSELIDAEENLNAPST